MFDDTPFPPSHHRGSAAPPLRLNRKFKNFESVNSTNILLLSLQLFEFLIHAHYHHSYSFNFLVLPTQKFLFTKTNPRHLRVIPALVLAEAGLS